MLSLFSLCICNTPDVVLTLDEGKVKSTFDVAAVPITLDAVTLSIVVIATLDVAAVPITLDAVTLSIVVIATLDVQYRSI